MGFGVAVGEGVRPQFDDDDGLFVAPLPLDGIVSKPVGRVPAGVNRRAAIARIPLTSGIWMEPRAS